MGRKWKTTEKTREYQREYRSRPEVAARHKAWNRAYLARPEKWVAHKMRDAKTRDLVWALPLPLALDLVTDRCFYCGSSPEPVNGIDRVDNTRGYVEDNVVTACKHCNTAKLGRSRADFEAWATRVARQAGAGRSYPD